MESSELLTTNRKALTINLDQAKYGTFAEIGAGQEVARHFFQAGGADALSLEWSTGGAFSSIPANLFTHDSP